MNAILARLRTLLEFVVGHSVPVDLRPESESVQPMTRHYYAGIAHLQDALTAFLEAKRLWDKLHEETP